MALAAAIEASSFAPVQVERITSAVEVQYPGWGSQLVQGFIQERRHFQQTVADLLRLVHTLPAPPAD